MKGLREPLATTSLALPDEKNDRVKSHYMPKLQAKLVSIFGEELLFLWLDYK